MLFLKMECAQHSTHIKEKNIWFIFFFIYCVERYLSDLFFLTCPPMGKEEIIIFVVFPFRSSDDSLMMAGSWWWVVARSWRISWCFSERLRGFFFWKKKIFVCCAVDDDDDDGDVWKWWHYDTFMYIYNLWCLVVVGIFLNFAFVF